MGKERTARVVDTALTFVWGIFFLVFPLFMTTLTTDAFILPKQLLYIGVVLLSLLLIGVKMIVTEKVTLKRTPFDLPMIVFLLALILSALFSVNRFDSLIATIPVVLAGFAVFILPQVLRKENSVVFVLSALLIGACATAVWALFSYFKVYPLFFSFTHSQSFTPLGSLLEQAFYFVFLLPVSLSLALPLLKGKTNNQTVSFAVASVILVAGLIVTALQLFTTQKPVLLPFETGFQTAFAAISQDAGRIAQGFLFGSGFGTFGAVFTRFKLASFNTNPNWYVPFTQSSSLILELLATTGILGLLSFLFLLFRAVTQPATKKTNPMFFGLVLLALASLVLPFSFIGFATLFIVLGLFAAIQEKKKPASYYDVELKFVALKKGMISLQQVTIPSHERREYNSTTARIVAAVLLLIVLVGGWFVTGYAYANTLFQRSLVAAASNNGTQTYKDQTEAINTFQYQSAYYRIFSQTNIALANSLASIQPKGSSPSAQVQSTLYALIQQGISTAKTATTLAPQSVANWQNLSSVYRSLIGLGQNADNFAILAAQQAVQLDPTNPQEYLALGGIYYQLGQWDNAIRQFQQAAALKSDYANAYYNMGHAYEQKGDYQNALAAYQAVKTLVANDKANTDQVNKDIAALQAKMGSQNTQSQAPIQKIAPKLTPKPEAQTQPLGLSGVNEPTSTSAVAPSLAK